MGVSVSPNFGGWVEPVAFAALVITTFLFRRAKERPQPTSRTSAITIQDANPPSALVKGKRCRFPIIARQRLSHDTILLRFRLPTKQHVLGLPAGQHLFCYAAIGDETVVRAYSTVTPPETRGHFDIALKIYPPAPPQHPEGGRMSQHLNTLKLGELVEFKGPVGRFIYESNGIYSKNRKMGKASKITMIAGGTGINPFIQILRKILENPLDGTRISLIYANKTEEDILFRHELDHLASKHWNFSLFHTLEKPSWHWTHGRGRVNQMMLERHAFQSTEESILLLCGPGPMTDAVSEICTRQLGWSKEHISVF